ncbi:hypothetical protein [Methanocorpusculum sp.]|uniref:hypothetical protein n=1 Tax=Methanocorpusculum sp. TaxID=2058474 RepID=UPI00272C400D|nr:hypothetical protein [Methanocorpusculum sp.]
MLNLRRNTKTKKLNGATKTISIRKRRQRLRRCVVRALLEEEEEGRGCRCVMEHHAWIVERIQAGVDG